MDALMDEVESLEAILMEDVFVTRNDGGFPELIETTVFPTVGEELDSQYVCITLQVLPPVGYPDLKPNIKLKNPRGLDDHSINAIEAAVRQKLEESLGQPVVFDLIDIIREHLTESNLPSGQCVICLYGFQEGDDFTKTVCYHYLHSHCLVCHLRASKRNYEEELSKMPVWKQKEAKPYQALCPVCREPIDVDIEPLMRCKPPSELVNAPKFRLTDELKSLQAQMTRLYLHQKSRGGIIDLNAEEGNVIAIETENANSESPKSTNDTVQDGNVPDTANVSVQQMHKQNSASSLNSHHHDRGSNSRHSGAGPGGSRNFHPNHNRSVRPQNGATGGANVSGDAGVADASQPQQQHHRGGHRHRRGNSHHHHHHHHHHHRGSGGGSNATTSQKNLNNPCSSGAR
ncbi:E3 ubiquitin-protein ligase RNF25 [Toxorhynchites rutilus septentrionalis]|uniref:E3 ubiquitin-protein ligase RNF25 n=1 Tax=Toxorhynchites rutilus septentrionalis TaxID=329112 RepID=UPI002478BC7F|nr:E3 ubiquitin-protein ligase RNF25 [Toxorhynchites rutilus septentrionalis]XP_055619283.1 E3 ubiquitin-protein ligase RNF25 [Toxorhynchites rutilus septentrionalis]